jgi:hypothetical protein
VVSRSIEFVGWSFSPVVNHAVGIRIAVVAVRGLTPPPVVVVLFARRTNTMGISVISGYERVPESFSL